MKEFFKKSTVYQNFKAEEDKELISRQECLETEDEINEYQDKITDIKQKYNSLQAIMFSQQEKDKKVPDPVVAPTHVKTPLMHTVPAPPDAQYDVPTQMRKPLIPENQTDKDDLRNVYNPNKYQNHIGNYAQPTAQAQKVEKKEQKKPGEKKPEEKKSLI